MRLTAFSHTNEVDSAARSNHVTSSTRGREGLLVVVLLLVAAVLHGVNMGNFPYYENDEGTYVSQAWSVLREGQLAPYYYWYDHPPAGWIQIAGWFGLIGGSRSLGTSVETGRVLMLLFQLGSTLLVYLIARSLSGKVWVAAVAAALFALSAYGIYYHRRVLLDNVATFWMLLAIQLAVSKRPGISRFWLSGAALAVGILSKEVLLVVGPGVALLVLVQAPAQVRVRAILGWLVSLAIVGSLYPLLALERNELFPRPDGVSLIGTFLSQASRGSDGGLLDLSSGFWQRARDWAAYEPLLVVVGTVAAIALAALTRWRPAFGLVGLTALSYWAFLGRGGETISFYVLPLLPLLALSIGLTLHLAQERIVARLGSRWDRQVKLGFPALAIALGALGLLAGYTGSNPELGGNPLMLWQGQHAVGQREAIDWTLANLDPEGPAVIDMYMWADLHEVRIGQQPFKAAHYYWKVDLDPAIRDGVFGGDWRNVRYVLATPQLRNDSQWVESLAIVREALGNSRVLARFDTGWLVELREVVPR